MKGKEIEPPDSERINEDLISSLLHELDDVFLLFQDGVICDETFVGGSPMPYLNSDGSLGALTLEESRVIRRALMDSPAEPDKVFGLSLKSFINWIPFLGGNDNEAQAANYSQDPSPAVIGSDGHLLLPPKNENLGVLVESRLKARGLEYLAAYWYAISSDLEAKRREEVCGDLGLIDVNRRKLYARRLNATPFEQAAQEFSENISFHFCDDSGTIVSPESFKLFIKYLIEDLLHKTKRYWPIAPLLSLFDGIVVPVLCPMFYPHKTWASEHNFCSEGGAYDVGQFANRRTSLETTPMWNDSARQQALVFAEEALKHHLSFSLWGLHVLDIFSPYNREVHSSEHMDPTKFGGKIGSFGPPVHTLDVMQLIQPAPKNPEENVLERIMTYRNSEDGIWQ